MIQIKFEYLATCKLYLSKSSWKHFHAGNGHFVSYAQVLNWALPLFIYLELSFLKILDLMAPFLPSYSYHCTIFYFPRHLCNLLHAFLKVCDMHLPFRFFCIPHNNYWHVQVNCCVSVLKHAGILSFFPMFFLKCSKLWNWVSNGNPSLKIQIWVEDGHIFCDYCEFTFMQTVWKN